MTSRSERLVPGVSTMDDTTTRVWVSVGRTEYGDNGPAAYHWIHVDRTETGEPIPPGEGEIRLDDGRAYRVHHDGSNWTVLAVLAE